MQHKLTRLTALMLAVIMSFSMLLVPVQAASFQDVPENAWYKAAVDYVSEKGWMAGVGDMTFAPTQDVTRAMFVTVLAAYAEADIDNNAPAFSDTGAGKWYTGAAAWASEMEVVKGIGDGRFAPNRAITRQDLCTMLYKYLKAAKIQLKADSDRTYADYNSVAAYAKEAVGFCAASGLVTGFEDSSFRPRSTATRAQVAQILMRLDMLRKGQEVPDEPMPAQSFDGEAGEDMSVAVNAPEGALPENTKMTVSRVTDEAVLAAIKEKVCTDVLAAADITFTKDGAELEPSADVEVQISLDGLENIQNPTVVHVRPDGNVEYIEAELVNTNRSGSEKALRFYARDFSVYAVVSGDDNPFYNVIVNFYVRKNKEAGPSTDDSDWELINKQIIRSNQIEAAKDNDTVLIYDPGVPNLNANQSFEGWWRENSFDEDTQGMSVDDMNANIKRDYKDGTLATATVRNLYAIVYNVVYVEFHDQAGAVLRTDYHHVTDNQKYLINMTYTPFKDNQNFTGWVTRKDVLTLGDYPTYAANPDPVIRNNTEYTVTETLRLYPYLQEGYWLIFDPNIANNDSDPTKCEYKGPDFVAKGTLTAAPTFKNEHPRPGYELEGWYTDPSMRNRYTFGQALTKDTTLYAKWTPIEASYTVVFRVQNATDPYDNDVSNNTYSFYDSVSRSWRNTTGTYVKTKSGDTVSAFSRGTSNDTTLASAGIAQNENYPKAISALGQYYQYSTEKNANNSVTVLGDGSAVLYVYYDRMPVTLNFYDGTFSSSTSDTMYEGDYYYYYYTYLQYFGVSGNTAIPLTLVYNSSDTTDSGNLIRQSYASFKVTSTGASYTGTVYVFLQGTTSGDLIASITGLYGAEISDTDKAKFKVEDPYVYCYESGTNSSGNTTYTMMPEVTDYAPGSNYSGNAYTINYFCRTNLVSTGEKTLHQISQNPDTGEWGEEFSTDTVTNRVGLVIGNSTGRTFIGYNLSEDSMTKSTFVSLDGNTTYTFRYDNINGNHAYAYKQLNNYDLVFMSNSGEVRRETLRYRQHTAAFEYKRIDETTLSTTELYIPDDGPEGYYFEGWYTDNTFQNKFNFTGRMPARNLTLYAKWTKTRYRVFLDYAGGDSEAQITFPDGTYSSTWRLDYGEQVDENRIANVTRDGWVLLGWYMDPEFKHAFNFSMGANDSMVYGNEAYYYGIQMPGESDEAYAARMNGDTRRGTDPLSGNAWNDTWDTDWESHDYSGEYAAAGYESADKMRTARGEQHNVVHTIRLYAKWRQDPKGTIGIRVNYLGDHLPSTGYFDVNGQPHEWLDPEAYVDRADAYAQAASVPEVPGEQFLYWEILDEYGDPTERRVYPGQTWQVRLEDARRIRKPVPNPNCEHGSLSFVEAKAATCTENGNEAHWICNLCGKCFSDEAHTTEIDPVKPATGHTWGPWQYQESGQGGHYHICTVPNCNARAGGAHVMEQTAYTAPTTSGPGSKTETCTVCGYSKTTTLPMLESYTVSFSVPTGVTQPADQTGLEDGASVTLPTTLTGVPAGYTFLGWVENPVTETTETVTPIASFTVNGDDATLYALFTHAGEPVSTGSYELVSSAPADWTGNYVITYLATTSMYVMKGVTPSSNGASIEVSTNAASYAASGVSLSGTTLSNVANDYVFTMAKHGSYYSIQSASTGTYLGMNTNCQALVGYTSYTSTGCDWTPGSFDNASSAMNTLPVASGVTGYPYIGIDTTNHLFWAGSNSTNAASRDIRFWKETVSEATYYTTSIEGSSVEPESRSVKYFVNGAQVGSTLTVEDGSSITVGDGITVTWPTGMTFTDYWVTVQGTNVNFDNVTKYGHGTSSYTVNGADVNFYALFEGTTWTLTQFADVTAGVYALLTPDYHAFNGTISSGHGQSTTDTFVFTDGVAGAAPTGVCELTFTQTSNGFSMYNSSNGYLYAKKASSGNLAWSTSTPTSTNFYYSWRSYSSNWAYYNNDAYLRTYNNTFRTYSTNTNGTLALARKTSGYTTGTQVSGGNAVTEPEKTEPEKTEPEKTEPEKTEPEKTEPDEIPTRGLGDPDAETEDTVTYQLTDHVELGKTYLIVYGNAATAAGSTTMRAMNSYSASTSGYLMLATPIFSDTDTTHSEISDVTTSTGTIADCEWTVEAATVTANDVYRFFNASDGKSYYLYETSSSDGNLKASANPSYPAYTNWQVRKVNSSDPFVYLTNYYWDSQSSYYYYFLRYTTSGFSNYSSTSSINSGRMYLYEKVSNATPKYTLTIHYQYANGSQAYEDYVGEYEAGEEYNVASPIINGFTPNEALVSGNMPSGDHSRTVVYTANTVSSERWEPTQTIVPGEDYMIAYVLNGTPYLLVNYNVSAENHYSYDLEVTSSSGTSTAPLGYLARATVVTENGTEYVSGVNGAATDLQYCHWIFSANNGGTITSGYESGRSLYWGGLLSGAAGVSPQTSGDTWVWVPNSTGNMGAMRNTYTSSSGTSYTFYFYPRTSTGAESTSTTAPYAGVSQTSFTNVRLYHKVITQNTTWTVSFVDEDGVSMADEGYPSYEITDGNSVTPPTKPQREDYYFLGWFYKNSEGQEVQYNFGDQVHGDLTLIAHFLYAWEDEYIVTLRAVYGMKNTTGTTHIYWYANDGTTAGFGEGAGDRYEQTDLTMNLPYNIPTPTTWTGKATNGKLPEIEHRVFLGWARIPTIGSGVTGTEHPELTEDDLYLKWNAAEGKYYYLPNSDKLTSADIGGANPNDWMQVTQVYADESQPYHDFYAVWATYAYVFHSESGKLEAVEITRTDGVKDTVDLVNKVPSNCLYGGYYTEYGGVKNVTAAASMQSAQRAAVQNAYSVDHSGGSAERLVAVNGAEKYDGSNAKTPLDEHGNRYRFWERKNAYGAGDQAAAPSGLKVVPEIGTVYYLKEVPQAYLTPKYIYTYDTLNGNVIQDFYMLTLVDDNLYSNVGFRTKNGATTVEQAAEGDLIPKQTLAGYFSITQNGSSNGSTPPATATVNAASFGLDSGFVAFTKQNSLIQEDASFTLMPGWITLDGVDVNSRGTLKLTVDEGKTKITGESLPGTLPVVYSRIYVDTSDPILDANTDPQTVWETDNAQTKLCFSDNSNNTAWVTMTRIEENLYTASIPSGDWTKVTVVRWDPAVEQQDEDPWNGALTRTVDISLDSTKNKIELQNSWEGEKLQASFTGVYNP